MKRTIFLFSGEGTHDHETELRLLSHAPVWPEMVATVSTKLGLNLEQLWEQEIGRHRCPYSPLFTVVSQICLADLWTRWGFEPDVLIGHSTGELAAAYRAGLYSLEDVLRLALQVGEAAAKLDGQMIHGRLTDAQIASLTVNLSSFNFEIDNRKHVTLSGTAAEMESVIGQHPAFVEMQLPHPWHHPDYERHAGSIESLASAGIDDGRFVSGVTAKFETRLKADHWQRWLTQPIDFIQSMQAIRDRYDNDSLEIIEIGFHPVLAKCCNVFRDYSYVSSMSRGEEDVGWIISQRKKLHQDRFVAHVRAATSACLPQLDFDVALADQGVDSLEFVELAVVLKPYFPGLSPQDLFRYKSINQLIIRFGTRGQAPQSPRASHGDSGVVIAGMSCRLPATVETLPQFWDMLLSREDQVRAEPERGQNEAGYLSAGVSRFDHQYFDIAVAEARTMDPQQMLALELTEMLWRDAGIDPETLDKKRVGVYLGVWNQDYQGDYDSVYAPTGANPSIIASRISYHYDLRGPSWVSNTACSSSLVAVHYAAKDIEAGRIDYAIAGGVNMLLDERFSTNMRDSGFLSPDNRCKTFDDSANGYVRAEGGGLVLLANKSQTDRYYAELSGSAINQNGRRSQVITAPHPEAQEELIIDACQDAGVAPRELTYVECHGTGTKLGDPIEISALQNTVSVDRSLTCYLGSVKSNIGHLESASGIAGLIKSVAILNKGLIPPNLHFHQPNQYVDFESHHLRVVTEPTPVAQDTYCGISSFGFGGSNAHIVIKGAQQKARKQILPVVVPFDRERSRSLQEYLQHDEHPDAPLDQTTARQEPTVVPQEKPAVTAVTLENIGSLFNNLFFEMTRVQEIMPDVELTEQGLDSMSATELIAKLQDTLNIEIEPELLIEFPLRDQFVEEIYGLTRVHSKQANQPQMG